MTVLLESIVQLSVLLESIFGMDVFHANFWLKNWSGHGHFQSQQLQGVVVLPEAFLAEAYI